MHETTQEAMALVETVAAEASYDTCGPQWAALGDDGLESPRVNLPYVLARVLQIAGSMKTPEVSEAFVALSRISMPGGAFDAGCVETVRQTAEALWFVRTRLLIAEASHDEAALPGALVKRATGRRARMLRAVAYHCVDEDDPDDEMAREVASIRALQGSRHLDLASDLSRLAAIYRDPAWAPVLAADTRQVRPGDADEADRDAREILHQLGQHRGDHAHWQVELRRGWTALRAAYDQLQRGASMIFWPRGGALVPALGALRPAPTRSPAPTSPVPSDAG